MSDLYDFMEVDPKQRMVMLAQALRQRQQEQDAEAMRLQGEFSGQQQKADQYRGLGLLTSLGSNPLLQGIQRASSAAGGDYQQDARTTQGLLRGARTSSDPLRLLSIQAGMEKEGRLAEDAKTREARLAAEAAARDAERKRKAAAAAGAAEKKAVAETEKARQGDVKLESSLRKEFQALPAYKNYQLGAVALEQIRSAAKDTSGASDIALVTNYMRSLDPNTGVKEQEFQNAQNTGGFDDKARAAWQKIMDGQFLTPKMRQSLLASAEANVRALKASHDKAMTQYEGLASSYRVDPKRVAAPASDISLDPAPTPTPAAPVSPPAANARDFVRTFESEKGKFGQRKDGSVVRINPDGTLTPVTVKR